MMRVGTNCVSESSSTCQLETTRCQTPICDSIRCEQMMITVSMWDVDV